MAFDTVETTIASPAPVVLTLAYPSGRVQADYDGETGHYITGASINPMYSARTEFSLVFNAATITLTFLLPNRLIGGETLFIHLDRGDRDNDVVDSLAARFQPTRALLLAHITSHGVTNGGVYSDGAVLYKGSTGATTIADLPGLVPIGVWTPEHFGSDAQVAFAALETATVPPPLITGTHALATQPGRSQAYRLSDDATVTVNGGTWFPRLWHRDGVTPEWRKLNQGAGDPSPTITGAEYPIPVGVQTQRVELVNFWGAQHSDVNDNTKGRTGIDLWFANLLHYGEGDAYVTRTNGVISRHPRHAEITHVRGQNNLGMHNGQISAATDQVTIYGLGDMVLHDKGFDNVALRGQVIIMYANGADTYGYGVDRFGYMAWSRGANDIDGAFIARGKFRGAFYTGGATLSDNAAFSMAEGQRVFFGASGDATDAGYMPTTFGDYWAYKPAGASILKLGANGGEFDIASSYAAMRPQTQNSNAFRVYGTSVATSYTGIGQIGNVGYIGTTSDASDNTTFAIRTSSAGAEADRLVVQSSGSVNIATAGAALQLNSVVAIRDGTGSPEAVVTAPVGTLWLRRDGGASTTLYVKENGTGNTGWVAK